MPFLKHKEKTMTLKELVNLHAKENVLAPETIKKYHSVASIFAKDTGIDEMLSITHKTILDWRDNILRRSSAGNWNNYHRHMKALLQTAVKSKLINKNPFKEIKGIVHYPKKHHLLSDSKIKALFAFCKSIQYGWFWSCVITTLHYTGIRRKQLVALTYADFDLDNQQLTLRASSSKTKRQYTIPINDAVISSILLIKQQTKHLNQNMHAQIFNITLINPIYKAKKMDIEHIAKFFQKASEQLNFKVSPHRFRHTFATKLANNGKTSIKTVQNLLGHSSVHTTLGYVHSSMEDMIQAINLLE